MTRVSKASAIRRARRMRRTLAEIVADLETPGTPAVSHLTSGLFEQARQLERDLRVLSGRQSVGS